MKVVLSLLVGVVLGAGVAGAIVSSNAGKERARSAEGLRQAQAKLATAKNGREELQRKHEETVLQRDTLRAERTQLKAALKELQLDYERLTQRVGKLEQQQAAAK